MSALAAPRPVSPAPPPVPFRRVIPACYAVACAVAGVMALISLEQAGYWVYRCAADATVPWKTALMTFLAFASLPYAIRWAVVLWILRREYLERYARPPVLVTHWPRVTVCMPAYNEQDFIEKSIASLLSLDYPDYEVLVVDDGSQDATFLRASKYAGRYPWGEVRVLTKPNGGKTSAHNFAFREATGEFLLCVDADSVFDADCLKRSVTRMIADPTADAVAGYNRSVNHCNLLTGCQALEYVVWCGAMRGPQGLSGSVLCIPGPLGLFRRSSLQKVYEAYGRAHEGTWTKPGFVSGPFEPDTFAEDFDLTMAILALGGRVIYEPSAACSTDMPETTLDLVNQRYRWSRGSIQVVKKALRRLRTSPARGKLGRVYWWLLGTYVYDMVTYAVVFAAQMVVLWLVLSGASGGLTTFLMYLIYQQAFRVFVSVPILLDHREKLKFLWYTPLLELYGTFLLGGAFLVALIDEIFGTGMGW